MKKVIVYFLGCLILLHAQGQQAEPHIETGNKYFESQNYPQAEAAYRKALEAEAGNIKAQYNLAAALANQNKMDEAKRIYEKLSQHQEASIRSASFYNKGVIHTRQQELEASIEAYKNALRNDPSDTEARENLQKALQELKKQQQKKQQDQKKQQQQKNKSKMSQREAEQKLKLLEQKEKEAQERLQKNKERGGSSLPKDW